MFFNKILAYGIAIPMLLKTPVAVAVVLDFNSLAHDPVGGSLWEDVTYVGPTITEGEFQIQTCGISSSYGSCGATNLAVFSRYHIYQPDQGGASVSFWSNNAFVLRRTDGSSFDFYSIDFAPQQQGFAFNGELLFTFASGAIDVRNAIAIDDYLPGVSLSTFTYDLRSVTSVTVRSIWDRGQFDNIVLNQTPVAVVPEPETYAMLLAGLGLLGFTAKRRKQSNKIV